MFFRAGPVPVVGKDSVEIQGQCYREAPGYLFRRGIEDRRRKMGEAAVAGEKIAAEQKLEARAVETHVAIGVSWEMDRPQVLPHVDQITIVESVVS